MSAQLFDSHCHIHDGQYGFDDDVIAEAKADNVSCMICVGTDLDNSRLAVDYVAGKDCVYASIGIHPHEAKHYIGNDAAMADLASLASRPKVVAIGECGLDYYYNHSDKNDQKWLFEKQIDIAIKFGLPLIFHIRNAFDDFFQIVDNKKVERGVIHSFSATHTELEQAIERGLYVSLNGIMTFTKDANQLDAAKKVPLERLLVETDSPYLTPTPFRGKINRPKYVVEVVKFLSELRGESFEEIARQTTQNAKHVFDIT